MSDYCISIHALLAESDWVWMGGLSCDEYFYPRSPCGERPYDGLIASANFCKFLSTLSLRRATIELQRSIDKMSISIHALLAESDTVFCADCLKSTYFYPRSPCGERLRSYFWGSRVPVFLSTLSLRRATLQNQHRRMQKDDFYPRSPCGERPGERAGIKPIFSISIHALLAESDLD